MILQRKRIPRKRSKPRRERPELFFKRKRPLKVFADGREICNLSTVEGRNIYKARIRSMLFRQKEYCCNCKKPLAFEDATFEHEFGRGMGGSRRDDRIEVNGQRINGASHLTCNSERGSKRTEIWHGPKKDKSA